MVIEWRLTKTFDFDGQSVAFDTLGAGDPIVPIQGTPFSSCVWRLIARELARDHQVYVFDLLGYGQSEKAEGQDVSVGVQNAVLAALLRHLRLDRPKVVAHDFGGTTALRAHLLDGCEYQKLLLFDPVAIRPWGSPFVRHVRNHEAAFAGVPEYLQRAILRAYVRGAVHRPIADAELEPYLAPWLGPVGQRIGTPYAGGCSRSYCGCCPAILPRFLKVGSGVNCARDCQIRLCHFCDMAGSDAEGRFQAGSRHLAVARSQAAERRLRQGYGRGGHSRRGRPRKPCGAGGRRGAPPWVHRIGATRKAFSGITR
jgi:pimeloyl-ACP methyl ester carboxylesterase